MIYYVENTSLLGKKFIEDCAYFLPRNRISKMTKYRFESDQINCALGYVLLIAALKNENYFRELPIWEFHENGKPYMVNYPNLYFNISHCKNIVACILASEEVGIDVEHLFHEEDVAQMVCNENELSVIKEALFPEMEFCKIWTRKEAFLKMNGEGLRDDLKTVDSGFSGLFTYYLPNYGACLSVGYSPKNSLNINDNFVTRLKPDNLFK